MNEARIKAARAALDAMDDQARCDVGANCIGPRGVLEAFIAHAEAELARPAPAMPDATTIVPGIGHPTTLADLARLSPTQLWNRWCPQGRSPDAREAFIAARAIPFVAPVSAPAASDTVAPGQRDAERALRGIRRVIDQDTAREGAKATLALFLDDDVATLERFVAASSASLRDAGRYREVRQHAYRYGVGHPTPEQLDTQVDARIPDGGAGSQAEASSSAASEGSGVIMPRNVSDKLLLAAGAAVRAGLCDLTGSDGHVVKKTYEAVYAHLFGQADESAAMGTVEHVLMPAELDDDLWRAGIEAFRAALNLRTGLDLFTAKQTYQGLYDHLAARQVNLK